MKCFHFDFLIRLGFWFSGFWIRFGFVFCLRFRFRFRFRLILVAWKTIHFKSQFTIYLSDQDTITLKNTSRRSINQSVYYSFQWILVLLGSDFRSLISECWNRYWYWYRYRYGYPRISYYHLKLIKKNIIKIDKNLMIQYIRKTARQYQYFHNISFSFCLHSTIVSLRFVSFAAFSNLI